MNNDHIFIYIAAGSGGRYTIYEARMFNVFIDGTVRHNK